MALVSMRQLLNHVAEHAYGVSEFYVNNIEQVQAIMQAEACNSLVPVEAIAARYAKPMRRAA